MIGTGSQAGYLLWPTKRRWSNANFGHVLGLPPDDPRVRRLALTAYRRYARYLVEAMRLESQTGEVRQLARYETRELADLAVTPHRDASSRRGSRRSSGAP